MIRAIVVSVPDEFLERRAAEVNAEHPDAPPLTAADLLQQRLEPRGAPGQPAPPLDAGTRDTA